MQYRFFWINAESPTAGETALNQFLASHRILGIEREFIAAGKHSAWSVCVSSRLSENSPRCRLPLISSFHLFAYA